jgi:DNA-binding NarL/FixJ family response regulator
MLAAIRVARATLLLLPLLVSGTGAYSLSTDHLWGLTQREVEVLYLLAEGLSNPQIGNQLRISRHTVRAHVYSIYNKLNVNGRVQAAMLVMGVEAFT